MSTLKNPKGSTLESTGLLVLGAVVGMMGSRAVMAAVPNKTGLNEAEQKKQDMIKYGTRIVLAGSGFAGGAFAEENKANPFVKGVAAGAAAIQVIDMITEVAGKNSAVQKQVQSGQTTGKIVGKMLGLACPCDNLQVVHSAQSLNRPRTKSPRLRGVGYDDAPVVMSKMQLAITKAQTMGMAS